MKLSQAQGNQSRAFFSSIRSVVRLTALLLVVMAAAVALLPLGAAADAVPVPVAALDVPTEAFIGADIDFTVTFDNAAANPADAGYGPYIDLFLPKSGIDGATPPPGNDGITFNTAAYLGEPVASVLLDCPAGGTATHPLTGLAVTCPATPANYTGAAPYVWQLVVLELPFGSFVPDQPPAAILVSASMSDWADVGKSLPIEAAAGFRYGADPLDNPGSDPPIVQTPRVAASVKPILLTLVKSFSGPENETATGPNWVREYTIDVAIASGQTMTDLDVTDLLPNTIQYQALTSILVNGAEVIGSPPHPTGSTCPAGNYWVQNEPASDKPYNSPNNELSVIICSVTGTGDVDVSVTFSFYVPEYDADGNYVLGPSSPLDGGCVNIANDALIAGGTWDTIDPRDSDEPVMSDETKEDQIFEACALVIQKGVSVVPDKDIPPTGASPTDTLEYSYAIQVSDYFILGGPGVNGLPNVLPPAGSLVIDDVFSDGQLYDTTFAPTYEVDDRNGPTAGTFSAGVAYAVGKNLVVNDSQQPAGVSPDPSFFQATRSCGDGTTALQFDLSQQMIDDGRLATIYEILSGQIDLNGDSNINAADTDLISSTPILAGDVDLNKDAAISAADTSGPTFFTYNVLSGKMDVATPFGTIDAADTWLSPLGLTETATASLVGGCVIPGSTDPTDTVFPCNPGTAALQAPAVATVTYRTVMQDVYSCPVPSGDQTIDQNDSLSNDVDIAGHVLDNEAPADPTTGTTVEDSSASVTLPVGVLAKTVYARNGVIGDTGPFTPGDEITYKLRYTLPHSDFEDLSLSDYLPLPVLRSDDWNADNTGGDTWTFSDQGISKGNGSISASGAVVCDGASSIPSNTLVPASGAYTYGPGDTLHCSPGLSVVPEPPTTYPPTTAFVTPPDPVISVNPVANSLKFSYGNYDVSPAAGSVVEVLFTLRVQDDPFADGLYLTNQLRTSEENSFNAATTQDAIVQFQINEPVLNLRKGVIVTDNVNSTLAPTPVVPAGVTVQGPGTCARLSGPVNSDNVGATFNSNLTNADAGDRVTYAIVVENAGSGQYGAFDVTIQDSLPAPLTTGHVSNLCVQLGDGSVAAYTGTVNDLFGAGGIQLVDIDETLPTPIQGSLERGKLADGTPNLNGRNIAIITYDVVLPVAVTPEQTLINTSKVSNYASLPGGADFTETFGEPTDDASVTMAPPAIDKTIVSTNQAHTTDLNVAIGEIVTYQVVVTLPEGVSSGAKLVNTLDPGLAFVDCISVAASTGLSTDNVNGFDPGACNDSTNPTVAAGGGLITYDLGTVTNSNTDNTIPDTITFQYSAVVLNSTANNRGLPLNNAAAWQWDGGSITDSAPDVIIVEPELDVQKSANPTTGDAGDVIDFTLVIKHVAPSADAFDVTLSDVIPAGMTYVGGTLDCTTASVAPVCDDAGAPTITATWASFPDAGGTSIIKFQVTLDTSVQSGQAIINQADIEWTSLPDPTGNTAQSDYNDLSVERTGDPTDVGGAANDYNDSDTAEVKVSAGEPVKSIMATSEAHTGNVSNVERLAVGEIVRYKLVYRIPEVVDVNFQLLDRLPAGLQFLNDGTAKVSFVANYDLGTGITSSTLDPAALGCQGSAFAQPALELTGSSSAFDPECPLPDTAVSTSATGNEDTYGDGTDIYFKLGTLTNTDSDLDSEYVMVAFNALVLNVIGNQADDSSHINAFNVLVSDAKVAESNEVNVKVAEPNIALDKTVTPTDDLDAGDTINYSLTFVNDATGANGADAFDIVLQDTLDSNLTLVSVSVAAQPTYSAYPNNVDISVSGPPSNLVNARVQRLDHGDSITLDVVATVNASAPAGQIIPNAADLTYTGLEGTNGTTTNDTGSSNTGTPGSETGERTGDDGVGSGLNNYAATDNVDITLIAPAIVKQQPAPAKYTIGDQVVFDIFVTLPEGVTKDLVVLDTLPAGLGYVSDAIFTTTASDLSGLLTADFNGTLPLPTVSTTAGDGNDVSWSFGDTTNNVDDPNDTTNNSFVIRLTVVVQNVLSNQIGTILPNSATLNYTSNNQPASIDGGTVKIEVIEPQITTTKTVVPTTGVQAGDTVNYTVRFENTGNSTAYDVVAVDTLAQGVVFDGGSLKCVDQAGAVVPSSATPAAGTIAFQGNPAGSWDIPATNPDSYIDCVYTATVLDSVIVDGDHKNVVDADWSSQNDTTNPDERNYDDTPGIVVDGDQDEDDAVFNVPAPTFDKSDNGATTARIGDVINYTLSFKSPLGTLQALTINDVLPAGMIYLNDAAIGAGITPTPAPAVSTPNDGSANVTLAWNFGNAVVSSSPIQITFSARVDKDNVGNANDKVLINNAGMTYTNVAGTEVTLKDKDDVKIIEPQMTIDKTIFQGTVAPGDTVTVRIEVENVGTSTAYEVMMQDVLPAGLIYAGGLDCDDGTEAPDACDATGAPTISATWVEFPVGGVTIIQFQATVDAGVQPGAQIVNTARVTEYSSLPDSDPNSPDERDYPPVEDSDTLDVVGGSIGNYIWLDENSDGYQGAGESGIANVRVVLNDANGNFIAETWTDANGGYLFDNLPAGDYRVDVDESTLPSGMTQTPPSTLPGGDFGNQDQSGNGYLVMLPSGGENLTADFGYNYNSSGNVNNPATSTPIPVVIRPMLRRRHWATASGSTPTATGCRIPTSPALPV